MQPSSDSAPGAAASAGASGSASGPVTPAGPEATIAQLIGWQWSNDYDPDDLLTWLHSHGWSADIMTYCHTGAIALRIGREFKFHHELHDVTLLGALESAVRAVAS